MDGTEQHDDKVLLVGTPQRGKRGVTNKGPEVECVASTRMDTTQSNTPSKVEQKDLLPETLVNPSPKN